MSRPASELLGWAPVERLFRDTVGEVMSEYLHGSGACRIG
jgi:hypothetical protein